METEEELTLQATKNQKKKLQKKKNKQRRELAKEWQQRHVSPEYGQIMGLDSQSEIGLMNYNANSVTKDVSACSSLSSSGDENSDEDLQDFAKDGYHPVHLK